MDVAAGVVMDFSGLSYIKGLALGMCASGGAVYPVTGKWAYSDVDDTLAPTKCLAFDAAGRVFAAAVQSKKLTAGGSTPANSVRRVTITASCGCNGWKNEVRKAAAKAALK